MKKKQPLADIFILNTNAKPTLRKLLRELGRLSYSKKLIRIIVCDNNSTDGSKEMLTREFPDVHVVALKKNHGMSGLNYGFKMRKGELCFVLDDDSQKFPFFKGKHGHFILIDVDFGRKGKFSFVQKNSFSEVCGIFGSHEASVWRVSDKRVGDDLVADA